jgi:hypothetical protein
MDLLTSDLEERVLLVIVWMCLALPGETKFAKRVPEEWAAQTLMNEKAVDSSTGAMDRKEVESYILY